MLTNISTRSTLKREGDKIFWDLLFVVPKTRRALIYYYEDRILIKIILYKGIGLLNRSVTNECILLNIKKKNVVIIFY